MAKTLKMLYLHNADPSTTAANLVQVVSMCSAFAAAGYDVTLVLRSRTMSESEGKRFLKEKFSCDERVKLRLIRSRKNTRMARHSGQQALSGMIRKVRPDLCFVRDPRYFRLVMRHGIPLILELHNTRLHIGNRILDRFYKQWIIRGSVGEKCLLVVTVSEALAGYWRAKGIPPHKTAALHDGFSPGLFSNPLDKRNARISLHLPLDKRIVVYSGNLQPNRGIDYITALATSFPDILFVLVGGDPHRKDFYESECRETGIHNVLFTGHQPHNIIPQYLFAADILLAMWSKEVPTIRYCSPLKVFEYLATGKPALFPGYPTILEVVEDGADAFVSPPDDLAGFRQTLRRILEANPETLEKMAQHARDKALNHYTWEKRANRIISLLPEAFQPNNYQPNLHATR